MTGDTKAEQLVESKDHVRVVHQCDYYTSINNDHRLNDLWKGHIPVLHRRLPMRLRLP